MGEKIEDKDLLTILRKTFIPQNIWNSKTLKLQKKIKIDLKFQDFKSPLPHINGVKYMMC